MNKMENYYDGHISLGLKKKPQQEEKIYEVLNSNGIVQNMVSSSTTRPGTSLGQFFERFSSSLRRKAKRRFDRNSETPSSQIYAPASIAGFSVTSRSLHRPPPLPAGNCRSVSSSGSPRTRSSSWRQASDSGYVSTPPPHPPPPRPQLAPGKPLVLDLELYPSGKRQVKADDIYAEGFRVLECNAERRLLEHKLLDPNLMTEGETCTIIDEQSRQQPDYTFLVRQLINWLNDELAEQRIVVRDLQEDLYDGQVLCKLVEKFHNTKLDVVEVTQNEQIQKHKLKLALEFINRGLGGTSQVLGSASQHRNEWSRIKWSVGGIHGKNMVEILHLLVAMARLYRAPLKLPENVAVLVLVFQKYRNDLVRRSYRVQLTDESVSKDHPGLAVGRSFSAVPFGHNFDVAANRRDAFDLLLEYAPDKLPVVKQSLARFCNRHLDKINMSCGPSDDLKPEHFSDGLLLVFLISSLEDYFVPFGNLFTQTYPSVPGKLTRGHAEMLPFIDANNNATTLDESEYGCVGGAIGRATALEPASYICSQPIERLHNVNMALQLIEEAGLADIRKRVRPEEIVNGELKAVLRVLYAIFGRYKHL